MIEKIKTFHLTCNQAFRFHIKKLRWQKVYSSLYFVAIEMVNRLLLKYMNTLIRVGMKIKILFREKIR